MITTFSVDECWAGRWLGRSTLAAENGRFRMAEATDPSPTDHLVGTVFTGFRDSHVHLGLVDGRALVNAGIAAVDDLGWDAEQIALWSKEPDLPEIRFAGRILTAPGGYPTESGWAPEGTCETLTAPADAKGAVTRQLSAGASLIKVALNSDTGPTLDDATLVAVISHAHARGIKVVAHVQGVGQAERAWHAGVDRFAHTPWSERLDDRLVTAMARHQSWVST
ncbi:MAG: amidohydrolase, partial [Terrimesophilobacter sp.]